MLQLVKSGKIYWIKSLPTLKLRVMEDYRTKNLLNVRIRKNKGRGVRFFFDPKDVDAYVKDWESNHQEVLMKKHGK